MKNRFLFVLFGVLSIWLYSTTFVAAGFQDFLKSAQKIFETSDSISESEIVDGLKQALEIGTGKAVDLVSKQGGYYKNPEIKIPFADSLSLDLDQYVTAGALNGLFQMLAEEEKKIRSDPAARVTDLLKKVFGNK
jgi:hypothetical protein